MVRVSFGWIELRIECDCGQKFIAGEFQTECPYCERGYVIQLEAAPSRINLRIEPKPGSAQALV